MNDDQFEDSQEYEGEEIEIEALGIDVSCQPIELYKVFKIANLVGGGGEAKHFISEGYVAVNGELETRKRRKMYDGDFFEFNQEYYVVVCSAPITEPEVKDAKPTADANSKLGKKEQKKSKKKASNKNQQQNLSQQAKPKEKTKEKQSKKAEADDIAQPSNKRNGRNSIDFF